MACAAGASTGTGLGAREEFAIERLMATVYCFIAGQSFMWQRPLMACRAVIGIGVVSDAGGTGCRFTLTATARAVLLPAAKCSSRPLASTMLLSMLLATIYKPIQVT